MSAKLKRLKTVAIHDSLPLLTVVPQLSKCLKFVAVRGGLNQSNDLNLNKEIQQDPCVYCCSQNGAS